MQIINNFIEDKEIFSVLKNTLISGQFGWFYEGCITFPGADEGDFLFYHQLFQNDQQQSPWFNKILSPILGRLKYNNLIRAKANCYTRKEKQYEHEWHTDSNDPHKVALYFVNKNNGRTDFESGERIESEENTLIIFDGRLKHRSVSQTDKPLRITLNINFN